MKQEESESESESETEEDLEATQTKKKFRKDKIGFRDRKVRVSFVIVLSLT